MTILKEINIQEVADYIGTLGPDTKIYIGGDSECFKIDNVWHADYTLAIVVHKNGNNGCKIFGGIERERIYDAKKNRPALRLMNEVYKISELYIKLHDIVKDHHVEVHLDINPDKMHGSSCVVDQAIGYIRGTCNVVPQVKPNAFAASYCADRLKDIMNSRGEHYTGEKIAA